MGVPNAAHPIVEVILALYLGGDLAAELPDLLSQEVVTTDWMSPGKQLIGPVAFVEEMMEASAVAFPDATEEILAVVFDGSSLVIHGRFRATFAASYYGVDAHGGPLEWEIVDRWEIVNGLITEVRFGADTRAAWAQIVPGGN